MTYNSNRAIITVTKQKGYRLINLTENEKDFLNTWEQSLNLNFAELTEDSAWIESGVLFEKLEKIFPTKSQAQIKGTIGSLSVKKVILVDERGEGYPTIYYSNYKDNEYCKYPL